MDQVIDAALGVLAALLLTIGSVAVKRLADWLRLSADDKVRGYLMAATSRAIELAVARVGARVAGGTLPAADAYLEAVDEAAAYLAQRVPDALRRFRLDGPGLRDMVAARLHEDGHRPERLIGQAER